MTKKEILIKVGFILDHCRECPKSKITNKDRPDDVCRDCRYMQEIIRLRRVLEGNARDRAREKLLERARQAKDKFPFTPAEYVDMRLSGWSDDDIRRKHYLTVHRLKMWKRDNKDFLSYYGFYGNKPKLSINFD